MLRRLLLDLCTTVMSCETTSIPCFEVFPNSILVPHTLVLPSPFVTDLLLPGTRHSSSILLLTRRGSTVSITQLINCIVDTSD